MEDSLLKIVTAMTWLLAPVMGMLCIAIPATISFLSTSSGWDELLPLTLLMVAIALLWPCLAWAIAQLLQGRARRIHIALSVGLVIAGGMLSVAPSVMGNRSIPESTVTIISPPSR